jgi:hypothetical protein
MHPEAIKVLMLVIDVFESLHIPYFVGGSMASAFHGVARATLDVDIIAAIGYEHVVSLVKALGEDFYIDDEMMRNAINHHSSFNLIHLETMLKVDIFILKERPFDWVQFDRREEKVVSIDPEYKLFITTAEDIILAKLEWYRLGGEVSDRQWRDILGVLKVQASQLNLAYLKHWAAELKVDDLLGRALQEAM